MPKNVQLNRADPSETEHILNSRRNICNFAQTVAIFGRAILSR